MPEQQDWSAFDLGTPAFYRITVRGYLEETWSGQLSGISINNEAASGDIPITILQGELVDQAALFGVLNTLYGLGFPILAVDCLPAYRRSNQLAQTNRQE